MMFALDYSISDRSKDRLLLRKYNIEEVTRSILDFSDVFIGDVIIKDDRVDLSARWGWIPILHFAGQFTRIANDIGNLEDSEYEFTEYPHKIFFHREDNFVSITASYAPGTIRVGFEEFTLNVRKLLLNALEDIKDLYPGIVNAPAIKEIESSNLI